MGAILVEVAERIGPSLDWWQGQPFAFLLWTYYQLLEFDRRMTWSARMQRIDNGTITAMAFHDPKLLEREHRAAIAEAAASVTANERTRARAEEMLRDIEEFGILRSLETEAPAIAPGEADPTPT